MNHRLFDNEEVLHRTVVRMHRSREQQAAYFTRRIGFRVGTVAVMVEKCSTGGEKATTGRTTREGGGISGWDWIELD